MCLMGSVMSACKLACTHRDVLSHCHRVRARSWLAGGVLPGGCCPPRWSPSQSSNWAQSCLAKRSHPQAWWLHSLLLPPSLTLEEDRQAERGSEKHWPLMAETRYYNLSITSILTSGTILHIILINWKWNLLAYWLGHPEAGILGQSTQCIGTATWEEKSNINIRPLLNFQWYIFCVFFAELPLVDPSHDRCRTP